MPDARPQIHPEPGGMPTQGGPAPPGWAGPEKPAYPVQVITLQTPSVPAGGSSFISGPPLHFPFRILSVELFSSKINRLMYAEVGHAPGPVTDMPSLAQGCSIFGPGSCLTTGGSGPYHLRGIPLTDNPVSLRYLNLRVTEVRQVLYLACINNDAAQASDCQAVITYQRDDIG